MKKNNTDDALFLLLDNDSFIRWVISPTPQLDELWEKEMSRDSELRERIFTLKNIIKRIRVEEPSLSVDEKNLIWQKIKENTETGKAKKGILRKRWMQVASVAALVLLLAGGYFYISVNNKTIEVDYASMIDDEQAPQSGNISLILSDNKVIDIKKDSTEVVYDHNGQVNVDSEEIEIADDGKPVLNQLIVPYGKTMSLTLSDGTKIWVNSGTKLIYPTIFDKRKREIYLVGEVYMDVVKDEDCPFVIKTNHMDVKVLGTKLNVSAYNDESLQSVVLVTGAVNVESRKLKGTYKINPGQMFSYGVGSQKVGIQAVDVNNYISWINGYLLLHSERLDRVLQKLERHYNISFTYNTQELANIHVSGKLDLRGTVENVLNYIKITAPISYKVDGDKIEIKYTPKR